MDETGNKENQAAFKEKFKLNPMNKNLNVKQMIKLALHKKHCRELIRKMYEKQGIFKEDSRPETEKKDIETSLSYDPKTLEQVLRAAKGQSHLSQKTIKYLKNYIKKQQIPSNLRKDVWMVASGATALMNQNPNYYDNLNQYLLEFPESYARSIELDLRRTFPDRQYDPNDPLIVKMRKVLLTYAKRNPAIGYCQGFNFIVNKIFLVLQEEEEAFWLFVTIIENILPTDYFTWMLGVLVDLEILTEIVYLFCNGLQTKFSAFSMQPGQLFSLQLFSVQWFICLYTSFNDQIVDVIWDFLFIDGNSILFKAGLVLYERHLNAFLEVQEFSEVIRIFEECIKTLKDADEFYKSVKDIYISRKMLRFLRESIKVKFKKEMEEIELKKGSKQAKHRITVEPEINVCNPKWPICTETSENTKSRKRVNSFFAYRAMQLPTKIIHDYFSAKHPHNTTLNKAKEKETATIELKNYNQTKKTFEFGEKQVSQEEKEQIAKLKESMDPTQILSSMVIGRQQHVCIKKPATNGVAQVLAQSSKKTNDSAASELENFLKGSIMDHLDKEREVSRQKSQTVGGKSNQSNFSVVDKLINRAILPVAEVSKEKPLPKKHSDADAFEKKALSAYGSDSDQEESKEPNSGGKQQDESDDLVQWVVKEQAKEQNEPEEDNQPRVSFLAYLQECEILTSDWKTDYISKSSQILSRHRSQRSVTEV